MTDALRFHVGGHFRARSPGESTPYRRLYGEAPPKRGAIFKLAVYKRVGKIAKGSQNQLQSERNGG